MKKIVLYFGLPVIASLAIIGANAAHAQMMGSYSAGGYGMMGGWTYPWTSSSSAEQMSASDTQAIAAGQTLYQKLQSGQARCSSLTQSDFENLGEYFMQQVTGAGHPAMDAMISSMMGGEGDTAIHVAWGERYSGCDTSATLPGARSTSSANTNYGFLPMMGYGYGGGWNILSILWDVLWTVLVVIGIIILVRWLRHGHRHGWYNDRNALDILKERYAKGEIGKNEFEEKKKDLESK